MTSRANKRLNVIFGVLAAAGLLMLFQNCGTPLDFSKFELKSASNGNGTGYDGKAYVNHGRCDNSPEIRVKSTIILTDDGSGLMTRENCTDLPVAKTVMSSELKHPLVDRTVFVHGKDVFDLRDTPRPKLTRMLCWMTNFSTNGGIAGTRELMIWYSGDATVVNNVAPALSGQICTSDGTTTGEMAVKEEYKSSTYVEYMGSNSSGSSFDLDYYAPAMAGYPGYGSMSYNHGGVAYPTSSSTECYMQSPLVPMPVN